MRNNPIRKQTFNNVVRNICIFSSQSILELTSPQLLRQCRVSERLGASAKENEAERQSTVELQWLRPSTETAHVKQHEGRPHEAQQRIMTQREIGAMDTPPIDQRARSCSPPSPQRIIRASGRRDLRHSMQQCESAVPAVPRRCVAEKGVEGQRLGFHESVQTVRIVEQRCYECRFLDRCFLRYCSGTAEEG